VASFKRSLVAERYAVDVAGDARQRLEFDICGNKVDDAHECKLIHTMIGVGYAVREENQA